MTDLDRVLQSALQAHQRGVLAEAAAGYQQILAAIPDQPDALHLFGQLLMTVGQVAPGQRLVLQAAGVAPAEASFLRTLLNRAPFKHREALILRAISLEPKTPTAWLNLAEIKEDPRFLAAAFERAGADPIAHFNAANVAGTRQALLAAVGGYRQSLMLSPGFDAAWSNLGALLLRFEQEGPAKDLITRALALSPQSIETNKNLALILKNRGRLEAAAQALHRAIACGGGNGDNWTLLAMIRMDQGLFADADQAFAKAAEDPSLLPQQGSDRLFALQALEDVDEDRILAESTAWTARFRGATAEKPAPSSSGIGPLKLGLFSGDFRTHSVAYFVKPLLEALDPKRVQVTLFAEQRGGDQMTVALQGLAHAFVPTPALSDAQLSLEARERGMDVALDLAGHTGRNRLTAFAKGLAPVQGTWLGYPGTTGLPAVNFRLSDAVADPPGPADQAHTERVIRLPVPFICYGAPQNSPAISSGPAERGEGVVFGSFNNRKKLGPATIRFWAAVLAAVPNARLFVKSGSFDDLRTKVVFMEACTSAGIDKGRVEAVGWVDSPGGHLGLYERIDVALDAVPYNGTTTTCEALWMGVPVVTIRGDRHAARVGASLLTAVGKPEWVGQSVDAAVEIAASLAKAPLDLTRRQALREALRASPLMDQKRFAEAMTEVLYRAAGRDPSPTRQGR